MASVPMLLATANANQVQISLHYDDGTLLISDVVLVNNGAIGTVTVTLFARSDGSVVFGPRSAAAATGTTTVGVSQFNQHMITVTGKYGPVLVPPFNLSMEWMSR